MKCDWMEVPLYKIIVTMMRLVLQTQLPESASLRMKTRIMKSC